ncbi:MAG: Na(+)-translocating NADH-quinone reductase subunit C [Xanthomonadales bacterium]|nr:Na(+)-translocating NADH-quinone reductase subunit C [Xanthomonadales bacterium]
MADSSKSRDTVARTLVMAVLTSLVCSALVTSVAISLKPAQERNELRNRQQNILAVVGLLEAEGTIEEKFENIETRVVELSSGDYADDIDPDQFDPISAALNSDTGIAIEPEVDVANLKRRANHARVYLVKQDGDVVNIILPVRGAGLWSTMYGFIALQPDGNTIRGLKFYEHGETPGLGDQIDRPAWLAQWEGKLVYGDSGAPAVEVVRGQAPEGSPHQVDGMSGATLTGNGVNGLLQYWLGDDGFGPYLEKHWSTDRG